MAVVGCFVGAVRESTCGLAMPVGVPIIVSIFRGMAFFRRGVRGR